MSRIIRDHKRKTGAEIQLLRRLQTDPIDRDGENSKLQDRGRV
jgi:hypothetical protein